MGGRAWLARHLAGAARATLAVAACLATPTPAAEPLRFGLEAHPEEFAAIAAQFVDGRCPTIEGYRYTRPDRPSRVQGELLILCHALEAGGTAIPLTFVYVHNYNRALAEAVAGRIDIPGQTIWSSELATHAGDLLASAPVIRRGEWQVGLFTAATRTDVLAVRDAAGVRTLVAAAPRGWVEDWRALEALGLRGLIDVQENGLIAGMIARGHADITLQAFGRAEDLGYVDLGAGIRMRPIPGVKLSMGASRHFAVSRARPDAAAVVAAIDRGLAILRGRGDVVRVLETVGVLTPATADWTDIALKPARDD